MSRKRRIHFPGAFYHVTLRGNHRQDIFFCEEHRNWFDRIVAESIQRFNARVHAYCWMTNRIHLFIHVGETPLGRVMLRIASMYAHRVQKHLSTTGHLFERRHDPVLVDSDEYLLELLRYIHMNPVRARMVVTPDDYPWSSHSAYSGGPAPAWLTTDFALRMIHTDSIRAVDIYRRMMAGELNNPSPKPFDQLNPNDRRVLGDDDFLARVRGLCWRPKLRESIDAIVERMCKEVKIEVADLYSHSRRRDLAKLRAHIAQFCLDHRVASLSEVARKFGKDESSLRKCLLRASRIK